MTINIQFEHKDFVVIDKPSGIPMHDPEKGIISRFSKQRPEHSWFLAHRLDTQTSGCLILGKTSAATARLGEIFANREIEKYYLAISVKRPKKKQGLICGDMKKARSGSWMLSKSQEKPAITQFFSQTLMPGLRGFICKPRTGYTHQIRVALKSQGAPIIGDERYGGDHADRMYLHSFSMGFEYDSELVDVRCLPTFGEHFVEQDWPQAWLTPRTLSWPALKQNYG